MNKDTKRIEVDPSLGANEYEAEKIAAYWRAAEKWNLSDGSSIKDSKRKRMRIALTNAPATAGGLTAKTNE